MNLDNPRLVIDRKQDLLELCGNVGQQHERFRAELVRAMEQGINIIILCEHGDDIQSIVDVYFWQNPRSVPDKWVMRDGHPVKVASRPNAVSGEKLYKSLMTIEKRYNVRFEFCNKKETGQRIVELLEVEDG